MDGYTPTYEFFIQEYGLFIQTLALSSEAAGGAAPAAPDRADLTVACYRVGLDVVWPVVRQSEVVPAI